MRSNRSDIPVKHHDGTACAQWRNARQALVLVGSLAATVSLAATTGYQYDALGRLIQVTHNNGNVTTYTLDAAGNRTQVDEASPLAAPTTLNVPATSSTGSYSISWSGGGAVTSYELWESTNSGYNPQTRVYQGSGTTGSITGHGNGSYYYRVRGCVGSACTLYKTGGPTVVTISSAPGQPTNPSYVPYQGCSWQASWDFMSGATSYSFRDFSGNFQYSVPQPGAGPRVTTTYSYCNVAGYTGNPNDYKPKWVKSCNGSTCSLQTNFP